MIALAANDAGAHAFKADRAPPGTGHFQLGGRAAIILQYLIVSLLRCSFSLFVLPGVLRVRFCLSGCRGLALVPLLLLLLCSLSSSFLLLPLCLWVTGVARPHRVVLSCEGVVVGDLCTAE